LQEERSAEAAAEVERQRLAQLEGELGRLREDLGQKECRLSALESALEAAAAAGGAASVQQAAERNLDVDHGVVKEEEPALPSVRNIIEAIELRSGGSAAAAAARAAAEGAPTRGHAWKGGRQSLP